MKNEISPVVKWIRVLAFNLWIFHSRGSDLQLYLFGGKPSLSASGLPQLLWFAHLLDLLGWKLMKLSWKDQQSQST